jgi:hypothetical protein
MRTTSAKSARIRIMQNAKTVNMKKRLFMKESLYMKSGRLRNVKMKSDRTVVAHVV